MSHTGHEIVKCSQCGRIIRQCRCPAKDKPVRFEYCGCNQVKDHNGKELVASLRAEKEIDHCYPLMIQAADAIEAQAAELERLREQLKTQNDLCRRYEIVIAQHNEELESVEERLANALSELRCPDCGCADEVDAESSECGCDSPVCARTVFDGTLAEQYLKLRSELAKGEETGR